MIKIKFIKIYRLEYCNTIFLEVMDMKTVSVRLNAEEERAFTAYADLMGEPLSTLFKTFLKEKLGAKSKLDLSKIYLKSLTYDLQSKNHKKV